MAEIPPSLHALLQSLLRHDPPRAKSLCVTLLGDAIEPHGGSLWLSDLISLVTPLGINERLLRTSVFRLVAQDWLQSERRGRRSLYRLSGQGLALTQEASTRIYQGSPVAWAGNWTLVILPRFGNSSLDRRGELRRQLVWAGFGVIAPGVFALPRDHADAARKVLAKLKLEGHALVMHGQDLNDSEDCAQSATGLQIRALIAQCWDMEGVALQYRQFIATFGPMLATLDGTMTPAQAFAVRALTLHAWRRIVLHDPHLPNQMLPDDWPGLAAREICGQLYWAVFDLAEVHLKQVMGKSEDCFLPIKAYVYDRFNGRPDIKA